MNTRSFQNGARSYKDAKQGYDYIERNGVYLDNIWSSLCGHIDHNWCYFIAVLYKFISASASHEQKNQRSIFIQFAPLEAVYVFVYRGDTIHTSLLVFAEHSVTKFSSCFERCRIWHIVYSCMMKRMRVSKPDITSNRVVCLHIAKTMLVYAQNELTLLQSYRSDWIQHVHTFRIGKLSLTLTFFFF